MRLIVQSLPTAHTLEVKKPYTTDQCNYDAGALFLAGDGFGYESYIHVKMDPEDISDLLDDVEIGSEVVIMGGFVYVRGNEDFIRRVEKK